MKNLKKLNIENYVSENGTNFDIELSYEVFGKPLGKAPIVMVNHALTGNSTVSGKNGWWSSIIGNEKLIDTNDYTVIAFNFPGNGYDGFIIENYEDLILRDIAKIFIIGLEKLQIEELYAIIGGSIGGGLVWEMAAFGAFLMGREVAKKMVPRKKGTIIFTGASASVRGKEGFAAFSGAKHAKRALSQSMARELGPKGIHVAHIVIDGAIDTPWVNELFPDYVKEKKKVDGLMNPDDIAQNYLMIHNQPKNAWTYEIDLRPWVETW